ncbi:hypothetical protein [Calothrix sp. CCY 0018]|uniref:hypothetical protein n=1 Tax=Calothrix sp. CCY 0018 TaxID=3103864 RepID=UPI0039C6D84B
MNGQIYDRDTFGKLRDRKNQQKTSSPTTLDWGMPQVRSFTMQLKTISRLPDLKTSLIQAERYGHHLDAIQCAGLSTTVPIQMSSTLEEEEKKRISGVNLGVKKPTDTGNPLDKALHINKRLRKLNNHHQKDQSINNNKHFDDKAPKSTETSTSKSKNQDKENQDKHHEEHLKLADNNSPSQDPEVTRFLNKESTNNLPESSGNNTLQNPAKSFISPPPTYNEDKNTPSPKTGTRSQFLANREAMNLLGDNKGFAATQRAVKKVSVGDTPNKAKDNQHQVKLKNAAELVREQVIKDDRQVKEQLRGTFDLEPDIVEKEGGEQLILQKMQ